jgi:hypothetical protein
MGNIRSLRVGMFGGEFSAGARSGLRRLAKGRVFTLPCMGHGSCVICISGALWITREGDSGDHILTESSSWKADGPGKVVIEAVEDSSFRVLHQSAIPGAGTA